MSLRGLEHHLRCRQRGADIRVPKDGGKVDITHIVPVLGNMVTVKYTHYIYIGLRAQIWPTYSEVCL